MFSQVYPSFWSQVPSRGGGGGTPGSFWKEKGECPWTGSPDRIEVPLHRIGYPLPDRIGDTPCWETGRLCTPRAVPFLWLRRRTFLLFYILLHS